MLTCISDLRETRSEYMAMVICEDEDAVLNTDTVSVWRLGTQDENRVFAYSGHGEVALAIVVTMPNRGSALRFLGRLCGQIADGNNWIDASIIKATVLAEMKWKS